MIMDIKLDKLNNLYKDSWVKIKIDEKKFKNINLGRFLYNHELKHTVNRTSVNPGKGLFYKDRHGNKVLNLYVRSDYNVGDIIKFNPNQEKLDRIHYHFKYIICDGNESDYIWFKRWVNSVFTNPTFKPECWPMVVGSPGTGKSAFFKKIFEEYFGAAYGEKDDSNYNGNGALSTLIGKTICIHDEVYVSGKENYNKLKSLPTAKTMEYKRMHENVRRIKNFGNGILISNHMKPIKHILSNERRFAIFKVNSSMANDTKYFEFLDYNWRYFVYYFLVDENIDFNSPFKFDNYKTKQNAVNADICMDDAQSFIRYIIRNYKKLPFYNVIYKKEEYTVIKTLDFYEEFEKQYDSCKRSSLFYALMSDVIVDKYRVVIDKKRVWTFVIKSREILIDQFIKNNSGLDPLEDWIDEESIEEEEESIEEVELIEKEIKIVKKEIVKNEIWVGESIEDRLKRVKLLHDI
jgi:hypothetical protein